MFLLGATLFGLAPVVETTYSRDGALIAPKSPVFNQTIETPQDEVKRLIAYYGATDKDVEIGTEIAKAESQFRNVCNTNGCRYGISIFQITNQTFEEQCPQFDNIMDIEQNVACGMQMINDSQYYRWKPSEDKWLPELATTTRNMVLRKCTCGTFARARGLDFPKVEDVSELQPNSIPAIGHGVLFNYGHLAVITEISNDGFFIIESNFKRCKITTRFIDWNDKTILGFRN